MVMHIPDFRTQTPVLSGWQQPAPLLNANRSTPMRLIMRWKWRILAFVCVVTLISGVVIWHLKPRYSAESTVTIDVRQMRVINQEGLLSSPMLDESLVRSDMEAFGSINLARSVVRVWAPTPAPRRARTRRADPDPIPHPSRRGARRRHQEG